MDGLAFIPRTDAVSAPASHASVLTRHVPVQHSLATSIGCVGIGLHGGRSVSVRLRPAPAGHGVVFLRTDLGLRVPARFDAVADTRLCTVLSAGEARVGTVEHLMAALAAAGVDNVLVEVDGPELPILDGSAADWSFLLDCAGVVPLGEARAVLEVRRAVRVEDGDAFAELRPRLDAGAGFDMALAIDFAAGAIGRQALSFTLESGAFRRELSRARTFTLRSEIDALRRAGLALGGTLDNALVVDGDAVLNPGGLRMADEFVRHKMLDAVGDLALAGAPLAARFVGHKSGHALNNRLLRALFADEANFRWLGGTPVRLAA